MATTDRNRIRPRASFGRRELLALLMLAALVLLAPALVRAQAASDTLNLWWTAPGDDGYLGLATGYDVRYSTSLLTPLNFGTATPVPPPSPVQGGARQHAIVRGLSRANTYYFAVRTRDEAGNVSGLSNVVRWDWPVDASPPLAPSALAGVVLGDGKNVQLTWPPSSEADLSGYNVYRAPTRTGPWVLLTPGGVRVSNYIDAGIPDDLDQPWYQVTAFDVLRNESARSAPIGVPRAELARQALRWSLETGYPNPARVGETQRLPITLPPGSTGAAIDIFDGAGQRVRRLDIRASGPGVTEIEWDGRNDSGQLCAPGLYRAQLKNASAPKFVRLVRVP